MAKTLKIGSVGLGRLGYEHAKNIANYVTGAELTAICDTDAARVAQVAEELNVPYTYTDVAEMVKNPELDAIVADTPGFSILECMEMEPEELKDYYPEFFPFAGECRFDGCLHDREPQCRVKQAVAEGEVSAARYARYQKLLQELTERRENRYV